MSIKAEYLAILESEQQVDEGIIKNAIVGAAIVAGGIGLYHGSKPQPEQQQVSAPITKIQKIEQKFQEKSDVKKTIKNRYRIDEHTANQIVDAAYKHAAPDGAFPTAHHLIALAGVESSMNPNAKSKLKRQPAIGLTQVRPKMHGLTPKDLSTIDGQFKHSSAILQKMHKRMGNIHDTFTAYNNGVTGTLMGHAKLNLNYAPKILAELEHYKQK